MYSLTWLHVRLTDRNAWCILLLLPAQDYTRTGTYYCAIMENVVDFQGKVVMDVGAGSGILSLFAAQVSMGENQRMIISARHHMFINRDAKPVMPRGT